MQKAHTVDEYFLMHEKWQNELFFLYELLLGEGLEVAIKWNTPVFMWKGKNVIGLGAFKHHVAIWFYQGIFLNDPGSLLFNAQKREDNPMRQLRFKKYTEINPEVILDFVQQSIKNSEAGKVVKPRLNRPVIIPPELKEEMDSDFELKLAFDSLTKTRQREFCYYIEQAKMDETKQRRLKRIIPLIFDNEKLY